MKITVTGGEGFIGRWVQRVARERGHEVESYDLANGPGFDIRRFGPEHAGDATIHLAGILGTSELFDRVQEAVATNVGGSAAVIEACAKADAHLVQITMPQVWSNVYQATKACAGALADAYMEHQGLKVSHVLAYNVFGSGQKVHGVRKAVPTFSTAGWRGDPIEVWGTGESLIDLIHARDLAEIMVRAAECAPGEGEVIDAGTTDGRTVNWLAEYVQTVTGDLSVIEHLPMRAGEAELTMGTVASGKGLDLIGMEPPPLREDELRETIAWYRDDRP